MVTTTAPLLSVVVCSHNGAGTLPVVLASLRRQKVSVGSYELLVVDDGSADGTSRVAAAHGARVVRLDVNAGLAAARNAGVSAAHAELIAFTDDDCEVAPDWVAQLLAAFEDPRVDAVGGRVIPDCSDGFMRRYLRANNPLVPLGAELLVSNRSVYRLALYLRRLLPDTRRSPEWLYSVVGANMAFRRAAIRAVGGFDESFRFGGEEEDLCRRLLEGTGRAKIRYVDEAVVVHWFSGSIADALRRARAYGRGNGRSSLKDPGVRPIVYPFPLLIAAALAGCALTRHWRAAPAVALLPLVLYPRWAWTAIGGRSAEALAHPYLQVAQEICTMIGELQGLRAGYEPLAACHLQAD